MGQTAAAILVGVKTTKEMDERFFDKDGDAVWEALPYKKHPECGENFDVLGFSVAISNGMEDDRDAGEMNRSATLSEVGEVYKKEIAKARKKWDAFAAWMKERGHELPEPTLLLTIVERA